MAKLKVVRTVKAAGESRVLNVLPDTPDPRDLSYQPALGQLKDEISNIGGKVLDQGSEGSCTGFGLAAVINILSMRRGEAFEASPRMLYEMAQKHDQWPGEDYEGSSCRGAIKGWKNMGVCSEDEWSYEPGKPGELQIAQAMLARENPLGAYYRLSPNIIDYHAALNEVDAIYVSAKVHSGWFQPKEVNAFARIVPDPKPKGGHAFAIVGYNADGFIVQNSWGPDWGTDGFAIWSYEDWQANVSDGWVFRLGIPTPTIFGLDARPKAPLDEAEFFKKGPKRQEIAGHFAHFDDGRYDEHGDYWTTVGDIAQTAKRIKESDNYDHLLIFAHGGLNNTKSSARRIAALKNGFMRNRIYPFHIMYDTGLAEELKDVILRALRNEEPRAEGFLNWIKDQITERTDTLIEDAVRKPVTPLWDEMKRDARLPFEVDDNGKIPDGLEAIKIMADTLKGKGMKFHLAGHSTGGVLLGHLLQALDTLNIKNLISSCTLFAPACSVEFYEKHYAPRLAKNFGGVKLPVLDVYNLNEKLELDDNVVKAYRKSLLYLVSRALERRHEMIGEAREDGRPILGMQKFSKQITGNNVPNFHYSTGKGNKPKSESHGGFDNDANTMNALLKQVLGKAPKEPFNDEEMKGY